MPVKSTKKPNWGRGRDLPKNITMRHQTQTGGYVKGSLLKVNEKGVRTFSEVMPDGTLRGNYSYKDRREPGKKAYRTPWMPVAHKVYSEKCSDLKKQLGVKRGDYFCAPMIIRIQETTPGSNKHNLQPRQRKYYVIQEFYPEPRKVGRRSYFYEPRSWFMRWEETPEEFFSRLYADRDEKRKILPPIPEDLLDRVERSILLDNFDPQNRRDPVRIAKEQPVTRSTALTKAGQGKPKLVQRRPARPGVTTVVSPRLQATDVSPRVGPRASPRASGASPTTSPVASPVSPMVTAARTPARTTPTPATTNRRETPAQSPRAEEPPANILLNIDGILYSTDIPADLPDADIMDNILVQDRPEYTDLLNEILQGDEDREKWRELLEYDEESRSWIIDPDAETLTGEMVAEIAGKQFREGETLLAFIASIPLRLPESEEGSEMSEEGAEPLSEEEQALADVEARALGLA